VNSFLSSSTPGYTKAMTMRAALMDVIASTLTEEAKNTRKGLIKQKILEINVPSNPSTATALCRRSSFLRNVEIQLCSWCFVERSPFFGVIA
jgi:hypothetical protein